MQNNQQSSKQLQSRLQQPTKIKSSQNFTSSILATSQQTQQHNQNDNQSKIEDSYTYSQSTNNSRYESISNQSLKQTPSKQNNQFQNNSKSNQQSLGYLNIEKQQNLTAHLAPESLFNSNSNQNKYEKQISKPINASILSQSQRNQPQIHNNGSLGNIFSSGKLVDTSLSSQSFLLQKQDNNSHFTVASRPKQQNNFINSQTQNQINSKQYQTHSQYNQQLQQNQNAGSVTKKSPLRFRPASPPQLLNQNSSNNQNKQGSSSKQNTSNTSQSPGRIIPMKQIKIVHSPQPSITNQINSNQISPLIYQKQQQKSNSPTTQIYSQQNIKTSAGFNLGFGINKSNIQVSNFEMNYPTAIIDQQNQESSKLQYNSQQEQFNKTNSNTANDKQIKQPSQYELLREKAHQRRRSGNNSRQQSIFEAPKGLFIGTADLTDSNEGIVAQVSVIQNSYEKEEEARQTQKQISQNIIQKYDEDDDQYQITDDNEDNLYQAVPLQSSELKQMSLLDSQSNRTQEQSINLTKNENQQKQTQQKNGLEQDQQIESVQKPNFEEQLRKSLTDFCENQKSNQKATSRNGKSRNNANAPTSINDLQSQNQVKTFDKNLLQIELTKQSTIPSTNSIIQISLPLINDGKSFFLNKVKQSNGLPQGSGGTLNLALPNMNTATNFATQSTNMTQTILEKQTLLAGLNPNRSFNNAQMNLLQQSNSVNACQTNRSGSNNSGTFDLEMKKHGLANDLKKLDSFNQFIEKHSPKQSRQNSCSYIGDTLGGDGSYDSFRAPYIQNAKFKRAGSGDLVYNSALNSTNLNFKSISKIEEGNSRGEESKDLSQSRQANFQFPFQRRARSNSPPKQVMAQNVIQQKLNECISPQNKVGAFNGGSIIESSASVDQSQQSLLFPNNQNGKRPGPIKAQQNTNFLFGSQQNAQQNNIEWEYYNTGETTEQTIKQSALSSILQPEKYQQLAQAISLYLNGDYQQILSGFNLPGQERSGGDEIGDADISQDPEQMMKQSTDVDEWLLSGTSENETFQQRPSTKESRGQGLLERDEEEDNMIMRKIEENQIKQAQSGAEKTYIIDDIDEELIYVQPYTKSNNGGASNIGDKSYIKGDRRVTTVVEQQTWEDLEDEYDEDQNEANIVRQYEQMKSNSSASGGKKDTLQSYENSMNNSPALNQERDAMIHSSEFRIEVQMSEECKQITEEDEEENQDENLIDENEELVQSTDLRSYMTSTTPVSMIDLSVSLNSMINPNKSQKEQNASSKAGDQNLDYWMYKTFDNSKQLSAISGRKSPNQNITPTPHATSSLSQTMQQPINNSNLKGLLTGSLPPLHNSSRNTGSQVSSQHKSQQNQIPTQSLLISKVSPPKELVVNSKLSGHQTLEQRQQIEDNHIKAKNSQPSQDCGSSTTRAKSGKQIQQSSNMNQITRKFPARQSPREIKIDLFALQPESNQIIASSASKGSNTFRQTSIATPRQQKGNIAKQDKKITNTTGQQSQLKDNKAANNVSGKKSSGQKSNKENKNETTNVSQFNSNIKAGDLVQQPKTSQPNKFMNKNSRPTTAPIHTSQNTITAKKTATPYQPLNQKIDKTANLHQSAAISNNSHNTVQLRQQQQQKQHHSDKLSSSFSQNQILSQNSLNSNNMIVSSFTSQFKYEQSLENKLEQSGQSTNSITQMMKPHNHSQINAITNQKQMISTNQQPQQKQQQQQNNNNNQQLHKRQTSGSGHRHRRTMSTAFDPNFLDQIRNSEFDPTKAL